MLVPLPIIGVSVGPGTSLEVSRWGNLAPPALAVCSVPVAGIVACPQERCIVVADIAGYSEIYPFNH